MEKFYLSDYKKSKKLKTESCKESCFDDFKAVCDAVLEEFHREWDDGEKDIKAHLYMKKKASIGKENEVRYYKNIIAN